MIFHKDYTTTQVAAFTLIEAVVAIAVLAIGVASTIGALTKFNSMAAMSRNATGAYTVVMNQIDLFQSMTPFNPQKSQIPKDTANTPPTYDMTVTGVTPRTIGYKDPGTGVMSNQWPIYQYKDPSNGTTVVVKGTLTVNVTDLSPSIPNTYMAVVAITYTYLNRNYTFSMSTIRTSDI